MSTGADCKIIEHKPGEWYYELQQWPYGDWPGYDEFGPFSTKEDAIAHLSRHHANPGGWELIPWDQKENHGPE